jgi:hypothetical protein
MVCLNLHLIKNIDTDITYIGDISIYFISERERKGLALYFHIRTTYYIFISILSVTKNNHGRLFCMIQNSLGSIRFNRMNLAVRRSAYYIITAYFYLLYIKIQYYCIVVAFKTKQTT